jgi:hypothetical protein
MKSRRRIASPKAGTTPIRTGLQQGFAIGEMGFRAKLHSSNREARMSALGHKRTLKHFHPMSALPRKADMIQQDRDVRLVLMPDNWAAAIGLSGILAPIAFPLRLAISPAFHRKLGNRADNWFLIGLVWEKAMAAFRLTLPTTTRDADKNGGALMGKPMDQVKAFAASNALHYVRQLIGIVSRYGTVDKEFTVLMDQLIAAYNKAKR